MGKAVLAHCQQAGTQKVGLLFVKALLRLQKLADDVVQNHRRMGQSGVVPGAEGRDIIPVLVQPDGVGIGQHRRIPDLSAGIVADVHGRTGRQHRRPLSLTGVQRRCGLGIAEGVHDAMVAYPVAGAEILVSGVVKHAPAEAAHMAAVGRGVALHPCVAQRLRLPVAPGVIGLGRVHVTGMLGDQQRLFPALHNGTPGLAAGIVSGVGEVVVGVDVLQQVALFQEPHAGGRPAGVKLMGSGVGAAVQLVVVLTFVDAHAPEDDAGMVAVLQHHLPGVFHRLIFPVFSAYVLPAGNFREHQQSQSVAFVDKILALGIVGSAYRHAGKLLLQNPRVLPLEPLRNGVAHIRPALVPVQSPQESFLPVQVEAVRLEFGGTEAHLDLPRIHHPADFQQGHPAGVENGMLRVPALDAGTADGDHAPGGECLLHQHPLALLQLHQKDAAFGILQSGLDFQGGQVRDRYVQIFNIALFPDVQPDLPVKPAVGQIVDDKSEGRHLAVLRGVQLHRQPVFAVQNRRVGDVHPEGGIAAPVGCQLLTV